MVRAKNYPPHNIVQAVPPLLRAVITMMILDLELARVRFNKIRETVELIACERCTCRYMGVNEFNFAGSLILPKYSRRLNLGRGTV